MPLTAIQRQVASAIDIIIHLGRLRDKSRKVLEIAEVLGFEDGMIRIHTLYEFREEGMENGKIKGRLMKVEELVHSEKLLAAGYQREGIPAGTDEGAPANGNSGISVL